MSILLTSVFRAANVLTKSTYVDHAGNECDARTGLPVGLTRPGTPSDAAQVGNSGYSFYDDDSIATNVDSKQLHNVGRMLYVNEYD